MRRLIVFLTLFVTREVFGQFTPDLLQNSSYWADGKAEYNIYDAQIVREGVPRPCEVVHIFVRESLDPKQLVKVEGAPRSDSIAVLKLNQILHIPSGLAVYQQMHSTFWRVDNAQLLTCSLTSNDGFGNTFKKLRRSGDQLTYQFETYRDGIAEGTENLTPPPNAYFYDELPWLTRTLDFSKPMDKLEVQIAGSIIGSRKDTIAFKPATISFKATPRLIDVSVEQAARVDHFFLDRDGPHLLREWTAADGSRLKMKRNLKVDYWNYTKPGDRERALANPMLRQPD